MRLAIGDVHGRDFWKHYINEDFAEFYILGDYFDSYDLPFARQFRNFRELCETARKDTRIKLCLGNHDYHYLGKVSDQQYSGFQERHFADIYKILEQNIDLLKVVYVTADDYLISHAGVSQWFMDSITEAGYKGIQGINEAFGRDRNILNFNGIDPSGDDVTQSPIWIRPRSLEKQPLAGYRQIVGHTPVGAITTVSLPDRGEKAAAVTYIDTYDTESIYRF